jgi:hypothetical protein
MYWVSFSKDAKGIIVHVARNGGPRKAVGRITKSGSMYVTSIPEHREYRRCSTLSAAKQHARDFYQHGELQGVLTA